jgi:hypothetical protein
MPPTRSETILSPPIQEKAGFRGNSPKILESQVDAVKDAKRIPRREVPGTLHTLQFADISPDTSGPQPSKPTLLLALNQNEPVSIGNNEVPKSDVYTQTRNLSEQMKGAKGTYTRRYTTHVTDKKNGADNTVDYDGEVKCD